MDFTLSTEQKMIRDLCRNFVKNEIAPITEEMDRTGQFPYEVWKKMGDLGIVGIPIPEEYGGGGLDWLSMIIAIEIFASETAKRCADKGVQIHGGYGLMDEYPISRYWREVKFNEILDGTSEIQRLNVAKKVLKL